MPLPRLPGSRSGYRHIRCCESAPNRDPAPARVTTLIRCRRIQ
jgi:hypothetical protein